MKKIFTAALICVICCTSCSLDSDDPIVTTEFMPIESVDVPDYFVQGETYEIFVSYYTPNSCYVFNDIIFDINDNERTVAVLNTVYENSNCQPNTVLETVSFDLTVSGDETYLFKFYQGIENGMDHYYLVEVPIADGKPKENRHLKY